MRGFVGFLTLAIAAIVGHFAFPVVVVADEMMAPAIRSGDWSVMFALGSEPVPGRLAGFDLKGRRFVRRIVAGPGATVRFKRGALHVDGAPVPTKKLPGPEDVGEAKAPQGPQGHQGPPGPRLHGLRQPEPLQGLPTLRARAHRGRLGDALAPPISAR